MDINWQSYLNVHYPNLAKIYLSPSAMQKVNAQINTLLIELATQEKAMIDTTFYDLFVRIIEPNIGTDRERKVAANLLSFLDKCVLDFTTKVNNNAIFINQLKNQLDGLFRVNGSKYLDKVGELLSTLHIIKEFPQYQFGGLEYHYEKENERIKKNGKDVDILLIDNINERKVLIDVFNLSLDHSKIQDENGLDKLIRQRISKKIAEKRFNTENINAEYLPFLQPFVWIYDIDTVTRYSNYFKNLEIENVLPILSLRQKSNRAGDIIYDCTELSKIDYIN